MEATPVIADTFTVQTAEQAVVLLNPLRGEILGLLREPKSASEVARAMNEQAQRINYHLKALEKVGLARRIGSRQVRNLVEVLYQAVAKTFVISDSLRLSALTARKAKDQGVLAHIVTMADRMRSDAIALMERSDRHEEIPNAALRATVVLKDEDQRKAFLEEYAEVVQGLIDKYGSTAENGPGQPNGEAFSVIGAIYPAIHNEADHSEGGERS